MSALDNKTLSSTDWPYPDCIPFVNWQYNPHESEDERAVVFRSLVATMKLQPALDESLEEKAVRFLKNVVTLDEELADAFLFSLGHTPDESLTNYIHSIVVLLSSPSQVIPTAAMKMFDWLTTNCSARVHETLVKADLIPQLINTLNPHSLSFAEAVDIHTCLIQIIAKPVQLATPFGFILRGLKDDAEQQAVYKTVLKQVVAPSEKYIWHLCVNRYSIIDWDLEGEFMALLANLLRICPYYQPAMDFVVNMPVILSIPGCLTFFEDDSLIWSFLEDMVDTQQEWNRTQGEVRQQWKTVRRMMKMEGIEDVIEEKLLTNRNVNWAGDILEESTEWNNLQGMNVPQQE